MRAVVYVGVVGTLGLLSLGASAAGAQSSGQAATDVTVRRLEGQKLVSYHAAADAQIRYAAWSKDLAAKS